MDKDDDIFDLDEQEEDIDDLLADEQLSDYVPDDELDEESSEENDLDEEKALDETELATDEIDLDDKSLNFDNKFIEQILDPHKEQNMAAIIDDVEFYETMMFSEKDNTTTLYLTKYEKTRAIGERATMISKGAPSTLDPKKLGPGVDIDMLSPLEVANLELKHKCMPFIIKRRLPNNKKPVYISINKLIDTLF